MAKILTKNNKNSPYSKVHFNLKHMYNNKNNLTETSTNDFPLNNTMLS